MWGHLNVRCCRPAWFLEPSFFWAVQCIHCSIAAPRLQYLRGLLGLKNVHELKHFGWHVAFLYAGCRVKWLLASMLACSTCVAGRHVELYDGQAAPITVYGISYDNYYGAYLIMALIFIAGVLAGIAGLKIWQHFFVVEVENRDSREEQDPGYGREGQHVTGHLIAELQYAKVHAAARPCPRLS